MITNILPLLNRVLPVGLAFKGLQKLDPRIGRFLDAASLSYSADSAVDFLRNEFETQGMRPDEKAARAQAETSNQGRKLAALGIGSLAAFAGDEQENQGIPLPGAGLPPYNPTNKALPNTTQMKGLPSPEQAGQERQPPIPPDNQAIQMGMKRRTGANNFYPSPEEVYPTSDPDDPYSFLANYDPRLADSVRKMVEKGWTPEKAHEIAHLKYGAYARPIAKMENDMGKSFIQIMKGLFGGKSQSKAALQSNSNQALIAALNAVRESRAKRQPK